MKTVKPDTTKHQGPVTPQMILKVCHMNAVLTRQLSKLIKMTRMQMDNPNRLNDLKKYMNQYEYLVKLNDKIQ